MHYTCRVVPVRRLVVCCLLGAAADVAALSFLSFTAAGESFTLSDLVLSTKRKIIQL